MRQLFLFYMFFSSCIMGFGQNELKFTSMCWLDTSPGSLNSHVFRITNVTDSPIYYTWLSFQSKKSHGPFLAPASSTTYIETFHGSTFIFKWQDINGHTKRQTKQTNVKDCSNPNVLPYWAQVPVGNVVSKSLSFPEYTNVNGNQIFDVDIESSGLGFHDSTDNFFFAYKKTFCDATISAKLMDKEYTNLTPDARMGVMIREGYTESDPFISIMASTSDEIHLQYRLERDAPVITELVSQTNRPISFKIAKQGNTFQAAYAIDSLTWELAGEVKITMDSVLNYGLATYSNQDSMKAGGEFSEVKIECILNSISSCSIPDNPNSLNSNHETALVNWNSTTPGLGYEYRYREADSVDWIIMQTEDTSAYLLNLNPNTTYEWQVRSICDSITQSAYGLTNTFVTNSYMNPLCPYTIWPRIYRLSATEVAMIFVSREDSVEFEYRYRPQDSTNWLMGITANNRDTLTNLFPNTLYKFQIKIICNDSTTSDYSPLGTFITPEFDPFICLFPDSLNTLDISHDIATLNWRSADSTNVYEVQYKIADSPTWNSYYTSDTSLALSGLTPETLYEWQIRTICLDSTDSPFSPSIQFYTLALEPIVPIANWPMDESNGILAQDIIGSHNGILNGFIPTGWRSEGQKGGALAFNGIMDFVFCPTLIYAQNNIEEVSVALWIKTSEGKNQGILSLDKNEYYSLEVSSQSALPGQISWNIRTNQGLLTVNSQRTINDDSWHFVVATFNKGKASIYIDGMLDQEGTLGTNFGSGTIQQGAFIGVSPESLFPGIPTAPQPNVPVGLPPGIPAAPPTGFPSPPGIPAGNPIVPNTNNPPSSFPNFFAGYLDEIRIYDKALDFFSIQQIFNEENETHIDQEPLPLSGIWLEAECGNLGSNWRTHNIPDSSGQYIAIKEGNNSYNKPSNRLSDRVSYPFTISEAGDYNIYFRTLTPGKQNDSFWVKVDKSKWIQYNNIDSSVVFKWDQIHDTDNNDLPVSFPLIEGEHLLEISYREDHALLDKIFISLSNQAPEGVGPDMSCNQIMFSELSVVEDLNGSDQALIDMKAYPNPTSSFVNIQLSSTDDTQARLFFINTIGEIVKKVNLTVYSGTSNIVLPVHTFPNGLYIVKYFDGKNELAQRLIITR